jgi:hypothetical protein
MEQVLYQRRAQFEVDRKSDLAPVVGQRLENPHQMEPAKGPIGRGHVDSLGPPKHGLRVETLADHGEANDLIRVVDIALMLADSGRDPPRQKLRSYLGIVLPVSVALIAVRDLIMSSAFSVRLGSMASFGNWT